MLIGIDGNEANTSKRLGVGEYAYELLMQFSTLCHSRKGGNPDIAKHKSKSPEDLKFLIYLKNEPLPNMPKPNNNLNYRILKPKKLWTQWRLPLDLYMHRRKPDVFFTPTHYAPRFSSVPTVITILDLAYLYFPKMFKKTDFFKLKNWTAHSIRNAKSIITISKSSKNDIIKEYQIPEEKIIVVYPGIKPTVYPQPQSFTMDTLQSKYKISKNFILFVGTLQPRKNISRLIEAFAKTLTQKEIPPDLQLIIVGKKGWLYEDIIKKPKELEVEEKVKFLDFITDDELTVLYKNAICYVLPSLYEGFGLPVLEAMQHNCPVITSNVSSLPEAGGDAALYVNPEDISDIAEKIKTLIINKQLRQELIQKGKKQITKFSWEKTAKETLKVLEQAARG